MTINVVEFDEHNADEPLGTGCLRTERGNLPLHKLDVRATITGLVVRTELRQGFRNPFDVPLEATYVFPLPDHGAVTAMTMTADGRTVVAELRERARARQDYDDAIAQGRRASIAEEERPDVFTMRVGNIAPGERVEISLATVGPLPFEDGEATFRFPLVVAPRYIPGNALPGDQVGDGYARDTDDTPDASRITPPTLLPGFPNPVDLSIEVAVDPAELPLGVVRSSLHTVTTESGTIRVQPGERLDRDFILRLPYGDAAVPVTALAVCPDADQHEGTFQLTVIPPPPRHGSRGKDVVLLLDRSGSMQGWKIIAARRAAARIVDTLAATDRFAVLTFDTVVERPDDLPGGLVAATDRNRYRAVEHLARTDARGGTELLEPLETGLRLFGRSDSGRDRVLVLITDGQVGNEDQLLQSTSGLLAGVRVHTVGIDQAVNAGFLRRLATVGGGRCELVESEDRLDDAMDAIHRRITAPLVAGLRLAGDGVVDGTVSPARLPDLFSGVPLVVRGRYRESAPALTLTGSAQDGAQWQVAAEPSVVADTATSQLWARAALRDLEDSYAIAATDALAQQIVTTSLRFGVLCRFTAFVAVDSRVVNAEGDLHRVIQPVELPAGWAPQNVMPAAMATASMPARGASVSFGLQPAQACAGSQEQGTTYGTLRRSPATRAKKSHRPARRRDATLASARAEAAKAVRYLERAIESEAKRSVALSRLAKQLEAVMGELDAAGIDSSALRAVVAMLRDESIPTAERWTRAREALSAFARGADSSARPPFWK
jgi:Ca-activated chloride channel family protein